MADFGSAKYLEDNIGGVLAQALAEMAVNQPKDGVGYLASWLKSYAEQEEAKAIRLAEEHALEDERAKCQAILSEKEEKRLARVSEQQHIEAVYNGLLNALSEPAFNDSMWNDLVNVAQMSTGASAVYLGVLDEGEGETGPYISYEYASNGSEWMTEKMLPKDTGVTWGALTENPSEENFKPMNLWKPPTVEPIPTPVADGDEPPPEKPSTPYFPVNIECVTDVPEVHYFELTRLGAYLAIPLVYPSYYTSESYADAKQYQEDKKAEAKRREEEAAEAAAAAAAAAAEAAANGDAPADGDVVGEPEALPPVEEKPMVLRSKDVKWVLCLDSLGTNTAFEDSKVLKVFELCKAFGQCKSNTELLEVGRQSSLLLDEAVRTEQEESIAAMITHVEQETQPALEADEAEITDDRKDLLAKKYVFIRALETAKGLISMIQTMATWVVVPAEVVNALAALLLLFGFTKEDVYPRRKNFLKWEKLQPFVQKPLRFLDAEVQLEGAKTGLIPEHRLKFIQQLGIPPEFDQAKAREIAPSFEVIFMLLQAAIAYRQADLDFRKAEYTKQREEAGEDYSGPALEELDDDYLE